MKHISWIVLILIVSLVQYLVTDIPGRVIFWPAVIIYLILALKFSNCLPISNYNRER